MKILLAEDDPHISVIARLALEKLGGHQVVVAENGEVALELALKDTFDVILLDEMMPKLNGINVCRKYMAEKKNPAPVIFLSAKSQESDIKEFNELATGHIAKPFDPTKLNSQILQLLEHKSSSRAA